VENGRLEPQEWNSFQRGFKHTHHWNPEIQGPPHKKSRDFDFKRLENIFWGCLGKLANSLLSKSYLTPLLMRPLLTGVEMAGFTHRPGFEIKIFQIFCFPQNVTLYLLFYPVLSLHNPAVPGCSTQILPPFRLKYPPLLAIFYLKYFWTTIVVVS
jgi:hypothetical protein